MFAVKCAKIWIRSTFRLALAGLVAASVTGAHAAQYQVKHTPYLQLGDAPLGGPSDQVEILWQTIPEGNGTVDSFSVEYRLAGTIPWTASGPIGTLDTGVEGRVNRFVPIHGLAYDTVYEYRMIHRSDGNPIATYQETFRTRRPVGDTSPYTFVAYGDSAGLDTVNNFRSVQNRINQLDAQEGVAFSLLLGDNVYNVGSHSEFDARLDPDINPELTQYIASHIDYYAMGNHDNATSSGRPSRENYAVPRNGPAAGETPEENYSFDYGDVHFATIDANSLNDPSRLDNQLNWLVADMQASNARWKIAFVHHPVAGSPDKPESPGDYYYQQIVSRLRGAEVDLFMAGHSHLYHWTYPLLGENGGEATYVFDVDKDYLQGDGLVQIVAGTGGRSLRSGDFAPFPFDAAGYSTETTPPVEYGFARVDVRQDRLTVSYIAADDGAVLDSFRITPVPRAGDLDFNGAIDFDDITPFVLALNDPQQYEEIFGAETSFHGDTDQDGDLDFDDVAGLVQIFGGQLGVRTPAVPEPGSLPLAIFACAGVMSLARMTRRRPPA
jgi:hypothetical protein